MRARLVEHIEFIRGNPYKTLKVGKRTQIEEWFKTYAPYSEYEIKDDLSVYVKGYLDLRGTNVSELPDNLIVRGNLDLRGTSVSELPDDLYVGGKIYKDF